MTSEFIREFVSRRMKALGIGFYQLEMKTFNLPPNSKLRIGLWNSWLYVPVDLLPAGNGFRVDSNFGLYASGGTHFLQQFEHTGWITLENSAAQYASLPVFIAFTDK